MFGMLSFYCDCLVEENFDLLCCMKVGEFVDGEYVLCVKIDFIVFNMKLCDLVLYCIVNKLYFCISDEWYIYFVYDFEYFL